MADNTPTEVGWYWFAVAGEDPEPVERGQRGELRASPLTRPVFDYWVHGEHMNKRGTWGAPCCPEDATKLAQIREILYPRARRPPRVWEL